MVSALLKKARMWCRSGCATKMRPGRRRDERLPQDRSAALA